MNFEFTKLIREIESEIAVKYLAGCIDWANDSKNNAWGEATNRFEQALVKFQNGADPRWLENEKQIYRETILGLIREYKLKKEIDEAGLFFNSISSHIGNELL